MYATLTFKTKKKERKTWLAKSLEKAQCFSSWMFNWLQWQAAQLPEARAMAQVRTKEGLDYPKQCAEPAALWVASLAKTNAQEVKMQNLFFLYL